MSYSIQHLNTAGRATVFTILVGVFTFAAAFMLNLGATEFSSAVAQQGDTAATTSVTVVNIPPVISAFGIQEVQESSDDYPTNSGTVVSFTVNAFDDNGEDYWLLICSANATPTVVGGGATPPTCGGGATEWAVSAQTASAATATAATTTLEHNGPNLFDESNDWFGFVCDNNNLDPKCTVTTLGITNGSGTTSSPFVVNNPPVFSLIETNSSTTNPDPVDPGGFIIATSTSVDNDTAGIADTVRLFLCQTQSFDLVGQTCTGTTLASTTGGFVTSNATGTYQLNIPTQDGDYEIFPYVIDQHGHAATSTFQGATTTIRVDNVAPDLSSVINNAAVFDPNNGNSPDLTLTVEQGQTTGFRLDFETYDANSCQNISAGPEVPNYYLSIYRASSTDFGNNSSSTCQVTGSTHDENDCYTSETAAADPGRWNLVCTASTTACTGPTDTTDAFSCTFPLWYIADPSDSGTPYVNSEWRFQIAGADDDFATGTPSEGDLSGFEVFSFLAFDLNTFEIPFGALAPGETTDTLAPAGLGTAGNTASSTILATGNVSIDEQLQGSSMCPTFTGTSTPCSNSATSTIAADRMIFSASSTVTYLEASTTPTAEYNRLSSTTPQPLDLDVAKTISTSSPSSAVTYWGIEVPSTITRSGDYYGLNTFFATVNSDIADW